MEQCIRLLHFGKFGLLQKTSSIGYVLKYTTKDSDSGDVSFHEIKYCGKKVEKDDKLRSYAATHVVSAPEAYNAICGLRRQQMSPTIELLTIHEEGKKKIIFKKGETADEIQHKAENSKSKLERYFCRPNGPEFDHLTYCEYFGRYAVGKDIKGINDNGTPKFKVHLKNKKSFCAIKLVNPKNQELFALRLLLQEIPARSFDDLYNGFSLFYEAAAEKGLVGNDQEFRQCMLEAINMNRPPSDLQSLMLFLYEQGSNFRELMKEFRAPLEYDLLGKNITLERIFVDMFHSRNIEIPEYL